MNLSRVSKLFDLANNESDVLPGEVPIPSLYCPPIADRESGPVPPRCQSALVRSKRHAGRCERWLQPYLPRTGFVPRVSFPGTRGNSLHLLVEFQTGDRLEIFVHGGSAQESQNCDVIVNPESREMMPFCFEGPTSVPKGPMNHALRHTLLASHRFVYPAVPEGPAIPVCMRGD